MAITLFQNINFIPFNMFINNYLKMIFGLFLIFTLNSCIDPYEPNLVAGEDVLVVEATITDQNRDHVFFLSKGLAYSDQSNISANTVSGATITLVENGITNYIAEDRGKGRYWLPSTFKGKIGNNYQLKINLVNGTSYTSKVETMLSTTKIDNVNAEFVYDPLLDLSKRGRFEISVNASDPSTKGQYYRWNWKHYDKVTQCDLFSQTQGQNTIAWFERDCCEKECYNITPCKNCINIASDELTNGNPFKKINIGAIPYDSKSPYYLLVEQYSLTAEMYQFWNAVKEQTANVGGVFDTTPQATRGNIINTKEPTKRALGYFQVSAVSEFPIYINRSQEVQNPFSPTKIELFPTKRDCMPCEEKENRTRKKPLGF